ncbi:MAG TPA: MBL fold metallo-hydrolase [Clostridia bacterium]|nr:MBL fold metallo-hydrolase [Clostridia bacterium]
MEQVVILSVPFCFSGVEDKIHPVVLVDDAHMVLVDCGYTGSLPAFEHAFEKNGLSISQLTHVFITHHDHDHMGALAALKERYPHVRVLAGEEEAPFVAGERKSPRLQQAEELQERLPEAQKPFGEAFLSVLQNVLPVYVDETVKDGQVFPWCGGCTAVATPGHTPGHFSLYVNKTGDFITGDAAALENGIPVVANPQFTLDFARAQASLQKLLEFGAKRLICYHGGVYVL